MNKILTIIELILCIVLVVVFAHSCVGCGA